MMKFEQKVADFIAAEKLFSTNQKVLLAISGGADSTALLHVMTALKSSPIEIYCAHINHQLRGKDAQQDQDFVVEQCRKLNLPVITKQIDVRGYAGKTKLSIETAARQLRIESLLEIAKGQKCACIATAHHKNDNAETILQRLSRGTGLRGLCGIWPEKKFTGNIRFVRPLLCVTRNEIIRYLDTRNLKWRSDKTNDDLAYRRNFIRHRLLPVLAADCRGDIIERLDALAKTCRRFYRLICDRADAVWPDVASVSQHSVTLDSNKIAELPQDVKVEIVRRALSHLGASEQKITERHYENVLRLSDDTRLQLPNRINVSQKEAKIILSHKPENEVIETGLAKSAALNVPGKTKFGPYEIEAEILEIDKDRFDTFKKNKTNFIEWFDFDRLKLPLEVRLRKNGDRFWPLGLKAEKKVGKFLTTAKTSSSLRRKILVIADIKKIIWLCPVRISERVKVTSGTKRILQLKVCS